VRITKRRLADSFLIVPNTEYFFGEVRSRENGLDIIETFTFKDIAEIHLIRFGAIAYRFLDAGPLRSIDKLDMVGGVVVPEHVTANGDQIAELQSRRATFANFVAAGLFGRMAALRNSALSGAQYAGMDEIVGFAVSGPALILENSKYTDVVLGPKARLAQERPERIQIMKPEHIRDAIDFMAHLAAREADLEEANLQACMVMNYQAAILHHEQHSAASLALNFAVAESLVQEIFFAYGIVGTRTPKSFATRAHSVANITSTQFGKMRLGQRINALRDGGLLDPYLHQRLDEARGLRNALMHSAAAVSVRQAGNMQTAVRDLWSYFLDRPFELNMPWAMRL
jgi:hypothetical protein